jgi:hypothetical protein
VLGWWGFQSEYGGVIGACGNRSGKGVGIYLDGIGNFRPARKCMRDTIGDDLNPLALDPVAVGDPNALAVAVATVGIALAFSALVLWGGAQTIVKYDYSLGATDANMALQHDRRAAHAWCLRLVEGTRRHPLCDRVDALVSADGDDGVGRPWRAHREPLRQDLDRDAADRRLPACHARLRGARAARADNAVAAGLHRRDPGRHVLLHLLKRSPRRRQRGEELGDVARNTINDSANSIGVI